MMINALRIGSLALALLAALPACRERGAPPAPAGPDDAAIRMQLTSEPVSLDPALAEDGISMRVLGNVMDGLVARGAGGALEPRLAESWTISKDGRRYEFRLRPGALWSDGQPVTAEHFVAGIRRALAPATGAKLAAMLYPIRGAEAAHARGGSPDAVGVRAEGPARLVIELGRPAPYFLELLGLSIAMPARPDWLAAHGGKWGDQAPVTGPYRIAHHDPDRELRLEPNPRWWAHAQAPARPPAVFRIVRDESTAVGLFDTGQLDVLMRVPPFDYGRLKKAGVLRTDPFLATYYLAFNTRKPPFDRAEWRRAVAGAIHRPEIAATLGMGEVPARSWIPPGLEGHIPWVDPAPAFAADVKRVRARLAARPAPPAVEAGFDASGRNQTVMEKVQADLKSVLGLPVTLVNRDWKGYVGLLGSDAPAIYRFGWLSPIADPITHLQVFTGGNPNNYTGWSSPAYDRLVDRIGTLAPGPVRTRLIRRAQRLLVDEQAVVVPIYHYVQVHAVGPRVAGFRVNPFGLVRFSELSIRSGSGR